MDDTHNPIPDRGLWSAVLTLAIKDAFDRRGVVADEARHFILQGGRWFEQVCDMAGVNPAWVRMKVEGAMNNHRQAARIYEIGKRLERRK